MPREFAFEVVLVATLSVNSYGEKADALAAKYAGNVVAKLREEAEGRGCTEVAVAALDATVNRGATGTGALVYEHGEGEDSCLARA